MSAAELVTFHARAGAVFEAELGPVLAEAPNAVLRGATPRESSAEVPAQLVVKLGKQPADFGRLDLEQVACERLEHPNLAHFWGSARTDALGTVLAYERLGASPLFLLNAPSARPSFRDPETHFYPLPPGIALELAYDVLLALEHVHARGFVHGGVTVGNLFVRAPQLGADGEQRVLDQVAAGVCVGVLAGFGGARELSFLDALRQGTEDLELIPRLPGSVAAPETLFERAELGGRRVYSQPLDVYAFGALLYTLLTGRLPYDHLLSAKALEHVDVLQEIKLRETRGEVCLADLDALRHVPLHDSPFTVSAEKQWPAFYSTLRHVLTRCLDSRPDARPSASALQELFRSQLQLTPAGEGSPRAWVQEMFQVLPGSNRLRDADRPPGRISIREVDLEEFRVEYLQKLPSRADLPAHLLELPPDADPNTTISVRPTPAAPPPGLRRRITPLRLREVLGRLRERDAQLRGPFLLTTTALDQRALSSCQIYPLGSATAWTVVTGDGVQQQLQLTVGRDPSCDIVLASKQVSKKHALLEFDRSAGRWCLQDLRSANGTRLGERELRPRERVRLRESGTSLWFGGGSEAQLTFMEVSELRQFLRKVLQLASEAMSKHKRAPAPPPPTDDGFASEAPQTAEEEPLAADATPDGEAEPEFAEEAPESEAPETEAEAPSDDDQEGLSSEVGEVPDVFVARAPEDDPYAFVRHSDEGTIESLFLDEAPEDAEPEALRGDREPTRKLSRSLIKKQPALPPATESDTGSAVGPAAPTEPQEPLLEPTRPLEYPLGAPRTDPQANMIRRLQPHACQGARFRIVLSEDLEGVTGEVLDAIEVMRVFRHDLQLVQAVYGDGRKALLFSRVMLGRSTVMNR